MDRLTGLKAYLTEIGAPDLAQAVASARESDAPGAGASASAAAGAGGALSTHAAVSAREGTAARAPAQSGASPATGGGVGNAGKGTTVATGGSDLLSYGSVMTITRFLVTVASASRGAALQLPPLTEESSIAAHIRRMFAAVVPTPGRGGGEAGSDDAAGGQLFRGQEATRDGGSTDAFSRSRSRNQRRSRSLVVSGMYHLWRAALHGITDGASIAASASHMVATLGLHDTPAHLKESAIDGLLDVVGMIDPASSVASHFAATMARMARRPTLDLPEAEYTATRQRIKWFMPKDAVAGADNARTAVDWVVAILCGWWGSVGDVVDELPMPLLRWPSEDGAGAVLKVSATLQAVMSDVAALARIVKRWKARDDVHPLQSLRDSAASLVGAGADKIAAVAAGVRGGLDRVGASTGGRAFDGSAAAAAFASNAAGAGRQLQRVVRAVADTGGSFGTVSEFAKGVSAEMDDKSGDLVDAFVALLKGDYLQSVVTIALLTTSDETQEWLREALEVLIVGDPRQVATVLPKVVDGIVELFVDDEDTALKIHAVVQLVAKTVAAVESRDIEAVGDRVKALAAMDSDGASAAEVVVDALRILLPDSASELVDVTSSILSLYRGDSDGLVALAVRYGDFDAERVEQVLGYVSTLSLQLAEEGTTADGSRARTESAGPGGSGGGRSGESGGDTLSRDDAAAQLGSLTPEGLRDLFTRFDSDASGTVDFNEFMQLVRYLDLHLSTEKAKSIFATADATGTNVLTAHEFEKAVELLEEELSDSAVARLGFSRAAIAKLLLVLCSILAGVFAFLFLGIASFTTGTTFGAVVNSILPLCAGGGMGILDSGDSGTTASSGTDEGDASSDTPEKVTEAVEEALSEYQVTE